MVLAIVLKFALIEIMVIIIMKYNNIQKVVKEFKTVIYINIYWKKYFFKSTEKAEIINKRIRTLEFR